MPHRTGYVYDNLFLDHDLGSNHPESPLRLAALHAFVNEQGLSERLTPLKPLSENGQVLAQVGLIHTNEHIQNVCATGETGSVATLAAGAVLAAVDAVASDPAAVDNAFCAVRPPGHHAHNNVNKDGLGKGEGFCFFNNVAIGARYAQKKYGLGNILIIDWDYHHGNGTEDAFYRDNSVFYFSTHRLNDYPGTGYPLRTGEDRGKGYNLNVPLPSPGNPNGPVSDSDLMRAFDDHLLPALDRAGFTPDMIFISAGFDGREADYIGSFSITDRGFREITRRVMALAEKTCNNRIVSVLEGGYNPHGLALAAIAHLNALLE